MYKKLITMLKWIYFNDLLFEKQMNNLENHTNGNSEYIARPSAS